MPRNAMAFEVHWNDDRARQPGAFYFCIDPRTGERTGITHACPCGCGGQTMLWFRGRRAAIGAAPGDEWDVVGEWPKVSLTPSIGVKYDGVGNGPMTSPYHWHGYLTEGEFREC